jgi:hypothetical protein
MREVRRAGGELLSLRNVTLWVDNNHTRHILLARSDAGAILSLELKSATSEKRQYSVVAHGACKGVQWSSCQK